MRNIADQLLALLIILDLFFRRFFQTDPHFLEVLAELPDFIIVLHIESEVQISVADLFRCLLKLSDRP